MTMYSWLQSPNYTGTIAYRVQQERLDGSLWSCAIYIDAQLQDQRYFATEEEARAWGEANLR